jgi:hypothetical protein
VASVLPSIASSLVNTSLLFSIISPKQKKSGNDWRSFSHSRVDFLTKFFAAEKRQRYRFSPNFQKFTSRRFVCQAGVLVQ